MAPAPTRDGLAGAVASEAVRGVLTGPQASARVLGTSTHAWWLRVDRDAVVVADRASAALPNALIVDSLDGRVAQGGAVVVGAGNVLTPDGGWHIRSWWDPVVPFVRCDRTTVATAVRSARRSADETGLEDALRDRDADRVVAAADHLIGLGPGLTPRGDDVVVGAVAGFRHVAGSLGDRDALRFVDELEPPLVRRARRATTTLSATLIRLAFAGAVVAPLGALLRSVTGDGSVTTAAASVAEVGHTSGEALADGAFAGSAAACGDLP